MAKAPVLTKAATTDVRARVRRMLQQKPDWTTITRVEAEIIKNHLMKAKISVPELGVSFTIFADEPEAVGGEGSAPLMFGYFMAGALLCELAQYTWNAGELELHDKIESIKMKLEGGFPLRPLYGMDDTPGASAILDMKVETKIEGDATPEEIEKLARLAAARCPAHQSLSNRVPYYNTVELNGQRIAEFED